MAMGNAVRRPAAALAVLGLAACAAPDGPGAPALAATSGTVPEWW
jgi:hypothetical protein